jgi:RimJ/RimL family protein N-acetyltransferase
MRLNGRFISLRPLKVSDASNEYCAWLNDPSVNRFLESRFERWTILKLKNYLRKATKDKSSLFLAIILKPNGHHIGNIKLGPIDRRHLFGEIGIMIGAKDQWGKGRASEAILLLKKYAFLRLGLRKLVAGIYKPNLGSIAAFRKAGFRQEGVLARHYSCGQRYVDKILMAAFNPRYR